MLTEKQPRQYAIKLADGTCLIHAFPSERAAIDYADNPLALRDFGNYRVVPSVMPEDFLSVLDKFTAKVVSVCQEAPNHRSAVMQARVFVRDELKVHPVPSEKIMATVFAVWNLLHPVEQRPAA